jgi:hypothetical protein
MLASSQNQSLNFWVPYGGGGGGGGGGGDIFFTT